MHKAPLAFLLLIIGLGATPPRCPPPHLLNSYTMNGRIPIRQSYIDSSIDNSASWDWSIDEIERMVKKVKQREHYYYEMTDEWLYQALDKHVRSFDGATVGIVGSVTPWYESIVLAYDGQPYTIEYNVIETEHPKVTVTTVSEFEKNPVQFDYIISISAIEHDGLGRYGDPIDPDGDLKAMRKLRDMLKPEGLLFFSVPIAKDTVAWNAHRLYGSIRLPILLAEWKTLDSFGFSQSDFEREEWQDTHQPVFVLQ